MPKPRGRRHNWEREGKWATCTNCGLRVETRLVRKGGLPTCDEVLESKPLEIAKQGAIQSYFREYIDSYHRGMERFGVWWKVFTFSIFAIAAVLIIFAITLAIFFL